MNQNTLTDSNETVEIEIVSPEIGDCGDDYETECDRLEECYAALEAKTGYCVTVIAKRNGTAPGTYMVCSNGQHQILGWSIEIPSDLQDLNETAWNLFCK